MSRTTPWDTIDAGVERHDTKLLEVRAIAFRQGFIPVSQNPDEHFGHRDRRHSEAHPACVVSLEDGMEPLGQPVAPLQRGDDRRAVDKKERVGRQPVEVQRSHSSFSARIIRVESSPQSPRPVPARESNEWRRGIASYSAIGTSAATRRPRFVMSVAEPRSAASRS